MQHDLQLRSHTGSLRVEPDANRHADAYGSPDSRTDGDAMKRLIVLLPLLILFGCAKIALTTTCPSTSVGVSFALAGSTIGNQAIAMLSSAAGAAGLLAKNGVTKNGVTDTGNTSTMSYEYIPIFGADSGTLTCIAPVATPGVLVAGPPPAILH